MQKSLLKLLGIVALTMSTCVYAVGMGGINVDSALGQPLKADIDLVAISKAEKNSLVARLASPDIYKGAGLEYPHNNKFKFQIESRAEGGSYLKVSSEQPINDPFVSILVELTWSSGKLLREYTFLLDPPGYVAEQPAVAEVQAVAPDVQSAPAATLAKPVVKAEPAIVEAKPVVKPAVEPAKPAMAAPAKPAAAEPKAMNVATGSITVQRGDTLNKIATRNKPDGVSLERMLVALYRANAEQFDGSNMNRIRSGKILRLPDQNELMGVTQSEAINEIHTQTADWNAYRQKLASAVPASQEPQVAKQAATGKIVSSVADQAPVAKESAKEVLKLSKGETPGDKVAAGATGKPMTDQDKKNAEQEEAIAKAKAVEEEQTRAQLLEKNLKDMQLLAKLKSEAAAQAQSASGVASGVAAASAVATAPVVQPKPKKVAPKPVAEPPSLVDEILGEPLYLAGGAAVLLGLVGLGLMLKRRKGGFVLGKQKKGVADEVTSHIVMPPSAAGARDISAEIAAGAEEVVASDDVDPISEADLFLNFGRDAQAEEILKEALQNTPNNYQIHLKLLGIYANRKDVNAFSVIARQLQDSGDELAWQQAAAMGRKVDPSNPMYETAGDIEDADSATMQTTAFHAAPGVAFDADLMEPKAPTPDVDFDLGEPLEDTASSPEEGAAIEAEETALLPAADMAAPQSETMDFEVAAEEPSGGVPAIMDFDVSSTSSLPDESAGMDFDITSTDFSTPAITGPELEVTELGPGVAEPELEITGLESGIAGPELEVSELEQKVAETTKSELPSVDDLVFDVTSPQPSIPAVQLEGSKPAETKPADDAGMEFTLDFPVEDTFEKPATEVEEPAGTDFSGINLNFDGIEKTGESISEERGEHWHEVATKLDLAKAYQEMGDAVGAREILEEVLHEGDAEQCEAAQAILDQLA